MRIFLLISFVFNVALVTAEEHPACTNLYRRACSPGTRDDGTGKHIASSDLRDKQRAIENKIGPSVRKRLKNFLSKDENKSIENVILNAANVDQDTCSTDKESCDKAVDEWLYTYTINYTLGPSSFVTGLSRPPMDAVLYLNKNPDYDKLTDELMIEIRDQLIDPKFLDKVSDQIFPRVKEMAIERIQNAKLDPNVQKRMINRMKSMRYSKKNCSEMGTGNGALAPQGINLIHEGQIRICDGLLAGNTSEFMLVFVLAHELAHSIDPCHLEDPSIGILSRNTISSGLSRDELFPIKGVISCLRGKNSIGARNFNVEEVEKAQREYAEKLSAGIPNPAAMPGYYYPYAANPYATNPYSVGGNPYPNPYAAGGAPYGVGTPIPPQPGTPPNSPPPIPTAAPPAKFDIMECAKKDQIGEAFSDWVASEVMPQYMEKYHKLTQQQYRDGYSNAFTFGCDNPANRPEKDEHPAVEARLNRIFMAHPKIRAQLGCSPSSSKFQYCEEGETMTSEPALGEKEIASPKTER